nr:MAG: VanZ family protein [Pseudomonadota bacterium]
MSADDGMDALERTWRCCGWLLVALVIIFSLIPSPPALDVRAGDKLQHLFAYALLMGWFAQLHRETRVRLRLAAAFVALGVALEFLQGLTSWRSYEGYDMAANAVGVLLGYLAAPPRGPDVYHRLRRRFLSRG